MEELHRAEVSVICCKADENKVGESMVSKENFTSELNSSSKDYKTLYE